MTQILREHFSFLGPWPPSAVLNRDLFANEDEFFMAFALHWAKQALGWASPNPPVGAVFVKDGKILCHGYTQRFGGLHAETFALSQGIDPAQLKAATLYVTLEPCSHHGKQPPCVDSLIPLGLKRVVIAVKDPHPKVNGLGIRRLIDAGVQVQVGVLEQECAHFLRPFLYQVQTGKPLWAVKWAEGKSGGTASFTRKPISISNETSQEYNHSLRRYYDAILVGAGTYLADQPKLNIRKGLLPIRRHPAVIVFDPKGFITKDTPKFTEVEPWVLGPAGLGPFQNFDEATARMKQVIDQTGRFQSVLVEGGYRLIRSLLSQSSVQRIHRFRCNFESPDLDPMTAIEIPSNSFPNIQLNLAGDLLQEWEI